MKKTPNAFYAQSGGVTAVINASAAALLKPLGKTKIRSEMFMRVEMA